MSFDFKDFIKLLIGKTKDTERALMLDTMNINYLFNEDIKNISF
jgi:hypothetical protein